MSKRSDWCIAILLAGCVSRPDYHPPAPPQQMAYTRELPSLIASDAAAQRLEPGSMVPARWWERFGSPALNEAETRALENSPTLQAARATLNQARATLAAAQGGTWPQPNLGADVSRSSNPAGSKGSSTLYKVGPLVSFDFDLFGRTRQLVAQQSALVKVRRAELAAAELALCASTAEQAIAIAVAREQIRAVREIVELDTHTLELVRVAEQAGHVAHTDVLSAESQLASDRTLLPPLEQQLSVARHALALLVGSTTLEWSPPDFEFTDMKLPADLPVTLPAQLVRVRPDIRAAEAQLQAANAAIGVANAELYPSLTLSASWTSSAASFGGLFGNSNPWAVALGLTAPLWHGGTLTAQRQAALEAYAAQLGQYRASVLAAFGQVADVLRALQHDVDLQSGELAAQAAAFASLDLMQQSFQAGQANLLQVLDAHRQYQQARLGMARATGQRYLDTVALFAAMGGGLLQ